MARSIPSVPIPPPPPASRSFFHFSFPTPRRSPGGGHCQKQLALSDFKSSVWFHSNMCKYLHNCFALANERLQKEECTWYVKNLLKSNLSYYSSYKNTLICERLLFSCYTGWSFALFQKPHHGTFERVSWPNRGAFYNFKIKRQMPNKCPEGGGGCTWN